MTSHTFTEFMTFVGQMTALQIEVVALDTAPEIGPAGKSETPTTTGSVQGDMRRWVVPPPHGYSLSLDKPAPMYVRVSHAAPGSKSDISPWMSIEEAPEWAAENPAQG
jgi:hypothetical protein